VGRLDQLGALVRETFGPQACISKIDKLSERAAIVARLHLDQAPVSSVIAKFTESPVATSLAVTPEHCEFSEEQLAHRFLATAPVPKKMKPNLLGFHADGLMLLEDPGIGGHDTKRTFGYLIPRLAEALACLHAAGRGQYDAYCALRTTAGLGSPDEDRLRYGKTAYRHLYDIGCNFILTRYEIATVRHNHAGIKRELNQIGALIAAPGSFLTFIHDDLGNARQTFEVGDQIYLLDF